MKRSWAMAVACCSCIGLSLSACAEQSPGRHTRRSAVSEMSSSTESAAGSRHLEAVFQPAAAPAFVRPELSLEIEQGESKGARRILEWSKTLRDSVRETKYQGRTVIRPADGYYAWDCSGMSAWILKRSAPAALRALEKSRPVARDFYKMIDRSPTKRARRGWKKLPHVSDARPGDLFAWLRSPLSKSRVSGHVGFFVTAPTPHPDVPSVYTARIMDATSLPHGNDTREQEGEGGFGFGTLLFATNEDGETVGYGWHGERSLQWGFMPAKVIYGRVTR